MSATWLMFTTLGAWRVAGGAREPAPARTEEDNVRSPITRRGTIIAAVVAIMAVPAVAVANHFTDVDPADVHAPGINYMEETGITAGCTATRYCPGDNLTRAQMGTFMHRASGHAPGIDPSVNAAELDGEGPSAYTTTLHVADTAGGTLAGATDTATAQVVASVDGVPAGTYVITGQVHAQGGTSARLVCQSVVDGTQVQRAIGRVGSGAGQSSQLALPVTASAVVPTGPADVDVRCHAEDLGGAAPSISAARTSVLVMRVGDAP
jgi:hypothetical protein